MSPDSEPKEEGFHTMLRCGVCKTIIIASNSLTEGIPHEKVEEAIKNHRCVVTS